MTVRDCLNPHTKATHLAMLARVVMAAVSSHC